MFFIEVISLTEGKMFPIPCKNNGKDKEFDYNFFLKFVDIEIFINNQTIILLQIKKFTNHYNIWILYKYLKNMLFSFWMKLTQGPGGSMS